MEAHSLPATGGARLLVTSGGASRQESVARGLALVRSPSVVVHDGARPFVTTSLVRRVLDALEGEGAIAAVPVDDTIKRTDAGRVVETLDRSKLWLAQTPQAFSTPALVRAHEYAAAEGLTGTDDSQLIERYGGTITIVAGSRANIKLTYPEDFVVAEAMATVTS